jgi:hypothetical protein
MGMMLKLGLKWFMEVVDASGFFVSAFIMLMLGKKIWQR